jgi:hypothetical protein
MYQALLQDSSHMSPGNGAKKPTAVSELLAKSHGMLERLRSGAQAADRTLTAVQSALPPELAARVWAARVQGTQLDVAVDSAAFASRIRYLESELRAAVARSTDLPVERCSIRVRPRG